MHFDNFPWHANFHDDYRIVGHVGFLGTSDGSNTVDARVLAQYQDDLNIHPLLWSESGIVNSENLPLRPIQLDLDSIVGPGQWLTLIPKITDAGITSPEQPAVFVGLRVVRRP
jgi:hypothetical protein